MPCVSTWVALYAMCFSVCLGCSNLMDEVGVPVDTVPDDWWKIDLGACLGNSWEIEIFELMDMELRITFFLSTGN